MERLTERTGSGMAIMKCEYSNDQIYKSAMRQQVVERLAAYEETGIAPKDVPSVLELAEVYSAIRMLKQYKALDDIDGLTAISKACEEGRMVMLPCKVGEQASINNQPYLVEGFLCTKVGQWKVHLVASAPSWAGNQRRHLYMSFKAFERKTRAEAEATLKGENDG